MEWGMDQVESVSYLTGLNYLSDALVGSKHPLSFS
jgi:hypothetical protein